MNDLKLTLIIIAAVAVISTLILLGYFRQKNKKESGLEDYCRAENLLYHKEKSQALTELTIQGEDFILVSNAKSIHNQTLDEYNWELETQWSLIGSEKSMPAFVLGSLPAGTDWSSQPELVKAQALKRLQVDSGLELDPASAQTFMLENKLVYLVFSEMPAASEPVLARLKPLLEQLSKKYLVYIKSGPAGASIRLSGCFVDNAELLHQLLELGAELSRE